MGFFKKFLGDAADELKKNLDESRNEFMKSFDDMKKSASGQRQDFDSDDDEDDDEPKIKIGDEQDGVLTLFEGITEMDDESLEGYEHLRKIVFPASLERLYSDVICDQEELEEVDFSKVTKLKTIPDDFISGGHKIRRFVIPNGVTTVGDGFLGEAEDGTEVFVPASVKSLGYITGNNDNNMVVYLYAANINIEDVEEDVKTFYVPSQNYAQYALKLKKCDSEARLREMPADKVNFYSNVASATSPAKASVPSAPTRETRAAKDSSTPLTHPAAMSLQPFEEEYNDMLFDHDFMFVQEPESGEDVYEIAYQDDSDLYIRKTDEGRVYRFYMYSTGKLCIDKDYHAFSKVDLKEFDFERYCKDYENDEVEDREEYEVDKETFYGMTANNAAEKENYILPDWEFEQFGKEENDFLHKHGFKFPSDIDVIYDMVMNENYGLFLAKTNTGRYFRINPFDTGELLIDKDLEAWCLYELRPFDFARFCKDYENDAIGDIDDYNIDDVKAFYGVKEPSDLTTATGRTTPVSTAPQSSPQMPPQMPPPMPGMQQPMPQVSYMIGVNGQQVGPFGWTQLQQFVQQGLLTQQTYVWTQGMPQWLMAAQVPELQPLFANVVPPLPGVPPMPGV